MLIPLVAILLTLLNQSCAHPNERREVSEYSNLGIPVIVETTKTLNLNSPKDKSDFEALFGISNTSANASKSSQIISIPTSKLVTPSTGSLKAFASTARKELCEGLMPGDSAKIAVALDISGNWAVAKIEGKGSIELSINCK